MLKILATCIGLFIGFFAFAQSNTKVRKFSLEEGLSQSSVYDIFQDSRGFLWVGTQDGLNQYNGYEFKIFRHSTKNITSISNNNIEEIKEDKNGNIWIATSYGLNKWNYKTKQFEWFLPENTPGLVGHNFYTILYSSDNKLWFVNDETIGYYDINKKKCISFPHVSSSIDTLKSIRNKLYESGDGKIWCTSTKGGVAMYDGKKWNEFIHDPSNPNSLPHNSIWNATKGPNGSMWFATTKGIANYNRSTKSFHLINSKSTPAIPFEDINDVDFDSQGNMWIVMHKHGLAKIDLEKEKVIHFVHKDENSISTDFISQIEIDHNNIWIQSYEGGVDFYNKKTKKIKHFKHDPKDPYSLSSNSINLIYPGKSGEIWIGTDIAGLNMYSPKLDNFKHVTRNFAMTSTLTNSSIGPIFLDSKDRLWVGTDEGLNLSLSGGIDFTNFEHNNKKGEIAGNGILTVYEDRKKRIWVGTNNGLSLYNENNSFDTYLKDIAIRAIYENDEGNITIVHSEFSLKQYKEETQQFETLNNYNFLENEKYNCIQFLNNKLILFGTTENGFYLYNKRTKEYKHYPSIFGDASTLSNPTVQ